MIHKIVDEMCSIFSSLRETLNNKNVQSPQKAKTKKIKQNAMGCDEFFTDVTKLCLKLWLET